MKKIVFVLCSIALMATNSNFAQQKIVEKDKKQAVKQEEKRTPTEGTISDFVVVDIEGNKFDFASLKGKKVMIVNTASECGLTPQYAELEVLYQKFKDANFIIIGFPANNFNEQEPGTNEDIRGFCQKNYGVTFPMMSKISVKGKDIHPLYQFLTQKEKNGVQNSEVEWNFQKYLIGREGKLEKIITPKTSPLSEEIIDWINNK